MANIVIRGLEDAAKAVEVAAEDALHFVVGAENKVEAAGPTAVSALGVLLGATAKAFQDASGAAAADGLNIVLDSAVAADVKAVWSDVVAFAATLGIKL